MVYSSYNTKRGDRVFSKYEEYLPMDRSLTLDEMVNIHNEMMLSIDTDPDALELYEELVETANRYSTFRANWCIWSVEEKLDKDPSRTACHNSLIVKFNQLARYLHMQGRNTNWRDILGYEDDDRYNRKRVGDFACYIVFINSICAR